MVTYTVSSRLGDDDTSRESCTWEPRSCADGGHQNDDGRWTGVVYASEDSVTFPVEACRDEAGGLGGGGGPRHEAADQYRVGDVGGDPPESSG